MAIRMDFVINAVLVAAILWRLPVMDWAIAVFGADAFSKWSGFWQSSIGSDTLASTLDFVSTAMPTAASDVLSSSVQRRAEGAVFGALLGDALALQTHYEYDYGKIRNFYRIRLNGTVEKLGEQLRRNADILGLAVTPGFEGADMKNWHPGKEGGDLTDHGDCVVMALEFLASHKWSLEAFDAYWWDWIQSYKGYVNMATKAIVKRRQAGHGGPGRLGWPPSGEDLFALCRLPALLFASTAYEELESNECTWAEENVSIFEPYPMQLGTVFLSKEDAKAYCAYLGTDLCGGITCWRMTKNERNACALVVAGANAIDESAEKHAALTQLLYECRAGEKAHRLAQASMEAASIQYATEATFTITTFLSLVGHELLHSNVSTRQEISILLRRVSGKLLFTHQTRFISSALDAVDEKLKEVELKGEAWSSDPVEVDDLAIQTFAYSSDKRVKSIPYPCEIEECPYWQQSGKASPTVPAFVAVIYLFLRYAGEPMQHTLSVNAMLGGDTATRGFVLGMLIGATQGINAAPSVLLRQLRVRSDVTRLLTSIARKSICFTVLLGMTR